MTRGVLDWPHPFFLRYQDWLGLCFSNSYRKLSLNIPGVKTQGMGGLLSPGDCPQSAVWPGGEASSQFLQEPQASLTPAQGRGPSWGRLVGPWEELRSCAQLQGLGVEVQLLDCLTGECWHATPLGLGFLICHIGLIIL